MLVQQTSQQQPIPVMNDVSKSSNDDHCVGCEDTFVFNATDPISNDLSVYFNSTLVFENEGSTSNIHVNPEFVLDSDDAGKYDSLNLDDIHCNEFTNKFSTELMSLGLNQSSMNTIFKLTETLLQQTNKTCKEAIERNRNPLEALNATMNIIINDIKRFNSTYKRNNFIEQDEKFVPPIEYGIGTQWTIKRNRETKIMEFKHEQSKFSYISPIDTLRQQFSVRSFRDTYFNYNNKEKHVCVSGVYRDFCCGDVYKRNRLFQENPNAIQLQLFLDGFEVCSDLKSKTTTHSQMAVYFTIRNLPSKFAYNMSNIHLLALVNENDLKKAETDYTNVLELIVKDIKQLELTGIDTGTVTNLKGNG